MAHSSRFVLYMTVVILAFVALMFGQLQSVHFAVVVGTAIGGHQATKVVEHSKWSKENGGA